MKDNSLRPLYMNRFLPSSLKSLTFSSTISSSNGSTSVLYVCGTRELVTAFQISVVRDRNSSTSTDESSVEVRVLSKGMVLAEAEGGEVRTMDIALIETDNEKARLILAGYSDGKLRVSSATLFAHSPDRKLILDIVQLWRHFESSFELIAETEGIGKCILSVEVAKVTVDGSERILAISGQSDGM